MNKKNNNFENIKKLKKLDDMKWIYNQMIIESQLPKNMFEGSLKEV